MNLSKRVDRLEGLFEEHIKESGEIRSDLKWLKGAFWALVALGTAMAGAFTTVGMERLWR